MGRNKRFPRKSLWSGRTGDWYTFFCPSCRKERRLPFQPKPTLNHFFQLGLTTGVTTILLWPWFDWKGIFMFVPLWAVFEFYYRLRVRTKLACPDCGFDPYLYLTDVQRARKEMETYWRKKFAEKGIPYPGDPALEPTPEQADGQKKDQKKQSVEA